MVDDGHHKNGRFRSNRALDNLLWHWAKEHRPFVVYKEGSDRIGGGDPVPIWLDKVIVSAVDFVNAVW